MFSRSARIYDTVYSFKDYTVEAETVHAVIQARLAGASSLLDVACGTGKHLEQFRRWYDVEGLDLDPGLIEIAQERLRRKFLRERHRVPAAAERVRGAGRGR